MDNNKLIIQKRIRGDIKEICLAHLGRIKGMKVEIFLLKYLLKKGIFKYVVNISYERNNIGNKSLFSSSVIKSINIFDFSINKFCIF